MVFVNKETQRDRVLSHPRLVQPNGDCEMGEMKRHSPRHSFVVCADTQLGMMDFNKSWEKELEYSRQAIEMINALDPQPLFCCVCGDLVDMDESTSLKYGFTLEECGIIKDQQNKDFAQMWGNVKEDIPLVCLCGNHDVGNRPNRATIQRFKNAFGDDYLAFWANGTYNIVVNSNLFSDPSDAQDLYEQQLVWITERLQYAQEKKASCIFVFGHHPWFLYDEEEEADDMKGSSPFPDSFPEELRKLTGPAVPDAYFPIPKKYRMEALSLFKEYGVAAAFSGHFHQNMVSKTSWGMDMIVTSALSAVFESNGKPADFNEPTALGIRIVDVEEDDKTGQTSFQHRFVPLD